MKLSDLIPFLAYRLGVASTPFEVSYVDDFFREISKLGIKEIEVSKEEMALIVDFYLANVGDDKDGNQGQVLREGKIDKLLGIKLNV